MAEKNWSPPMPAPTIIGSRLHIMSPMKSYHGLYYGILSAIITFTFHKWHIFVGVQVTLY